MQKPFFAAIGVLALSTSPSLAQNITVKAGETLSEIATRHKISVKEIILLNNLGNSDLLYPGQTLKLPQRANDQLINRKTHHTVLQGETINSIAKKYRTRSEDLIILNRLQNPNRLYPGQKLKLPRQNYNYNIATAKKPSTHIIREGETLSYIADKYSIKLSQLISINTISNPNNLSIGSKVFLHSQTTPESKGIRYNKANPISIKKKTSRIQLKKSKSDWRDYGPLQIDWSNWQPIGNSFVAPSMNKDGKALYLAINCTEKKLNATGANGTWKDWVKPIDKFEHLIINDFCD